jgi:hypothetical protein
MIGHQHERVDGDLVLLASFPVLVNCRFAMSEDIGYRAERAALQTQIHHHALAAGFSRGYLVSAGIMALILIIALAVLRVRRQDLSGSDPAPAPAGDASSAGPHPGSPAPAASGGP